MQDDEFLSVEEIAKLLGLKEETIRQYIRDDKLTAYKFGHIFRVRKDDFDKFLEQRRTGKDRE